MILNTIGKVRKKLIGFLEILLIYDFLKLEIVLLLLGSGRLCIIYLGGDSRILIKVFQIIWKDYSMNFLSRSQPLISLKIKLLIHG